jgi:hypothetical protein
VLQQNRIGLELACGKQGAAKKGKNNARENL